MSFVYLNLLLGAGGLMLFVVLYLVRRLVMLALGMLNPLFGYREDRPVLIALLLVAGSGLLLLYVACGWSAYNVGIARAFIKRPAVTWDWLYLVAGFAWIAVWPLGWAYDAKSLTLGLDSMRRSIT